MERTQLCPDLLGMRLAAMAKGDGGSGENGVCGADDKSMDPIRSTDELRLLQFQLNFLSELDLISGVLNGDDPAAPTLSLRLKRFSNLGAYNSPSDFCFSSG
jgi:hypothetical protein